MYCKRGSTTTTYPGQYMLEVKRARDGEVTFLIDGSRIAEKAIWEAGRTQELNLSANIAARPGYTTKAPNPPSVSFISFLVFQ